MNGRNRMTAGEDPAGARRYLSSGLRAFREKAGLTQEEVAASLYWSLSKVVRLESGAVSLQVTDLLALLGLYKVSDVVTVAKLTDAAQVSRKRPRHRKYPNALEPGFDSYLSYECSASKIMTFQTLTIPGLLQTEAYTRAILTANRAPHVTERIKLRQERQSLLQRANPPEFFCVIDEAALHRQVGGPTVMHDQLVHLQAAAESDMIAIEVIPYSAGAYQSMIESFTLLRSPRWDEDVLFREGTRQTVTEHEDHDLIAKYRALFDRLREVSLKQEVASSLIGAVIRELADAALPGRAPKTEQQD
jgi:transcriptional regulator with XRE-family HTH domain